MGARVFVLAAGLLGAIPGGVVAFSRQTGVPAFLAFGGMGLGMFFGSADEGDFGLFTAVMFTGQRRNT